MTGSGLVVRICYNVRVMTRFVLFFLLGHPLLALLSCNTDTALSPCEDSSECDLDGICISGWCRQSCVRTADCAEGESCMHGICTEPPSGVDAGKGDARPEESRRWTVGDGADPDWAGVLLNETELMAGDGDRDAVLAQRSWFAEDFEGQTPGQEPSGWLATVAGTHDGRLEDAFLVTSTGSNQVLSTAVTDTNIHCHYVGSGAQWQDYAFSGRIKFLHDSAGAGITFYSGYPGSDGYYRLRRFQRVPEFRFKLQPGAEEANLVGNLGSGVMSVSDTWYHFKIQVETGTDRTSMRGKVWSEDESEPVPWQMDAVDESPGRRLRGTIGVWSMEHGERYWDDLTVRSLAGNHVDEGRVVSPVFDRATVDLRVWTELTWNVEAPPGTLVRMDVRASDTAFTRQAPTPSWIPGSTELPDGRYLQWKATLVTGDPAVSPTLLDVTAVFSSDAASLDAGSSQ